MVIKIEESIPLNMPSVLSLVPTVDASERRATITGPSPFHGAFKALQRFASTPPLTPRFKNADGWHTRGLQMVTPRVLSTNCGKRGAIGGRNGNTGIKRNTWHGFCSARRLFTRRGSGDGIATRESDIAFTAERLLKGERFIIPKDPKWAWGNWQPYIL